MRRAIRGLAIIVAWSAASVAHADPTLAEYLKEPSSDGMATFVNGVTSGLGWANTNLRWLKRPELFCMPDNVTLSVVEQEKILSDFLSTPWAHAAAKPDSSLGLVYLAALSQKVSLPGEIG